MKAYQLELLLLRFERNIDIHYVVLVLGELLRQLHRLDIFVRTVLLKNVNLPS